MKKGDKLYVWGSCHISNGSSDTAGGLATVKCFDKYTVEFDELPGHSYGITNLLEKQEELAKQYAGKVAHPDPDIDTPWIEEGDIVNGKVYKGPPIW